MKIKLCTPFLSLIFLLGFFNSYAQWKQLNGPNFGNVNCIVSDGKNSFVGSSGGVFLSTNTGESWEKVNNGLTDFNITAMAISGTNIFAGTSKGSVFLSNNNGESWNQLMPTWGVVYSIAVNGANIFLGTRVGLFRSTDNGTNWSSVNVGLSNNFVSALEISNGNIFAGTMGGGVFLSSDNGSSWKPIYSDSENHRINSFAIDGTNIFAGTLGGGILLSTDNGTNWAKANGGLNLNQASIVYAFAISGTNIYAGTSGGMYISTDSGTNWNPINNGLTCTDVHTLAISENNLFAGTWGGGGIFLSENGGLSWSLVNNGFVSPDILSLAVNGSNIFCCVSGDGGGLFLSSNLGDSWTSIKNGLPGHANNVAIKGTSIFVNDVGHLFRSNNLGASWTNISEGTSLFINGSDIFLTGRYGGGLNKTTNDGNSWIKLGNGTLDIFIQSFTMGGTNLFAGSDGGRVFLSSDGGNNWKDVSIGLTSVPVLALAAIGSKIFAGTAEGVFSSSNNGISWIAMNNGLTHKEVISFAVKGTNIFAGTTKGGIFLSKDNGSSWMPVNDGLTVEGIDQFVIDAENIFAGTNSGVWVRPLREMIILPIVYPQIVISTSSINAEQNIAITGVDFNPNSTVYITINGPSGFSQRIDNIVTNNQGGFSSNYSTTAAMPVGIYSIIATDNVSGKTTPAKQFILKSTTVQPNNLVITSPLQAITVDVNEKFQIEWKDKMVLGKNYSVSGSKRNYKYLIEMSDNNGSSWKTLGTIEGQQYIDGWAELKYNTSIATPGSEYIIRITDVYNNTNTQSTPIITVSNAVQPGNLKADLNWDFSYPVPATPIEGVAAEGTARIFLNLSKIDNSKGPDISSVTVKLSDEFNGTEPAKLGKVKAATQTSTYSSEANGITAIEATDNTAKKSDYIFWYVAPDDFVGADPNDLKRSFRHVTATFTVNYTNGTTEILTRLIPIVRPPLMLVHGLASDASTWDNFRHNELGYELKFIDDFRFKTCIPVNILPDASFKTNADKMSFGSDDPNTFQGVIRDIRNKGYAANRVDYVCHSMGGCVLRSIYDNDYAYFTRTGIASKRPYKNYENGYVNKVIMIGTPNNGSPWADIVNRYAGDLSCELRIALQGWYGTVKNIPLPLMFMKQIDNEGSRCITYIPPFYIKTWEYGPNDAVRDMQIDKSHGGISFGTTNAKAHLIAGDIYPDTQLNTDGVIPSEVVKLVKNSGDEMFQKILNHFLKIAAIKEPDPSIRKFYTTIIESDLTPTGKALAYFDKMAMVIDAFNTGAFIPESDLVVSVSSQLAGYSKPIANKVSNISNVSVYDNFIGHAFFRPELNDIDIGNRVNFLLNSPINSTLFKNIPATPAQTMLKSAKESLANNPIISKTDTTKLKIIYPKSNATAYVDSSFHVLFSIKDTTHLKSVELSFQNKTYTIDPPFIGTTDMNLQVNNNLLDNQIITLEGYYVYPDSAVFAYDQINVNIVSNDTLSGFGIDPKILYLFTNETKYPEYYGIYKNAVSTGSFSSFITAVVNDSTIVKFDPKSKGFKGIASGETFATISYKDFSDTLYFVVDKTDVNNIPHFTPVWTGNGVDHMYFYINSAKIDGVDLKAGDEIGIFDGTNCVGMGTLTNPISQTNTLDIAVSRKDSLGNGYIEGNPITYRIFDKTKGIEISNVSAVYDNTDSTWSTDGKFAIGASASVALNGVNKIKQDILLQSGWNIISTNRIPTNPDMKELFQPLIDGGKLKKVMDEAGKTIENFGVFGGWKNNVGNLNNTKGYKVNVTTASTLSVKGTLVSLPLDIPLNTGWNIISYPSSLSEDVKAAFQSLIDAGKLKKVMDETGKTLENFGVFGGWKNNIGSLTAGKGYKVNVTGSCTLTITEGGTKAATIVPEVLASAHFKPVFSGNGTDHMTINLVDLVASGIESGDELGVFDGALCVGSAQVGVDQLTGDYLSIPVSANDGLSTEMVNGFTDGHRVTLKHYRGGKEQDIRMEIQNSIQPVFATGESMFVRVKAAQTTGTDPLAQSDEMRVKCYPNPFSEQVTIEIKLRNSQYLDVKVYDTVGRLIKMLYKGESGETQKLTWDGRNEAGVKMASGIYHIGINEETFKIIFKN